MFRRGQDSRYVNEARRNYLNSKRFSVGWDVREQDSRMEGIDASAERAGDETQKNWLVPHLFFSLFTLYSYVVLQVS